MGGRAGCGRVPAVVDSPGRYEGCPWSSGERWGWGAVPKNFSTPRQALGAGKVEGRCETGGRKHQRKISFMILKGVVSERKEKRGFRHAAGEIKARHGEGLSYAKTPERRWKLGGEVWFVSLGAGPGGEPKTLEGLQRPEPLLEVLIAVGGGLRERGPSGTQQKE